MDIAGFHNSSYIIKLIATVGLTGLLISNSTAQVNTGRFFANGYAAQNNGRFNRNVESNQSGYTPRIYQDRNGFYHYSSRPDFRPSHYGYWEFENESSSQCKSIYYFYGYYPYIDVNRTQIIPYDEIAYYNRFVHIDYYGDHTVFRSRNKLVNALSDIRGAWLKSRASLINNHILDDQMIAVLLDGKYNYSVESGDYSDMTIDAVEQMHTVGFAWQRVKQKLNDDYTAFGRHTYRDMRGNIKTIYDSYTLRYTSGDYYIVEVGSSRSPVWTTDR